MTTQEWLYDYYMSDYHIRQMTDATREGESSMNGEDSK